MTDVERLLAAELAELDGAAPHDPDLAATVRRRARRQSATALAAGLAVVAVLGVGAAVAVTRPDDRAPYGTSPALPAYACEPLRTGVLPEWARTGFSDPEPRMPFRLTDSGALAAIVFAAPLTAPPRPDAGNKILWVVKDYPAELPAEDFTFTARLSGSDRVVTGDLGRAPGPSSVDVPEPGCWHLELRWGTYADTIDLAYAPRR
jgi:hypothetical protein